MRAIFRLIVIWFLFCCLKPKSSFGDFAATFINAYKELQIPGFTFDYRDYFSSIPDVETIEKQEKLLNVYKVKLSQYSKTKLNAEERLLRDMIAYEIAFNLERTQLEKEWVKNGRKIPPGGLSGLHDQGRWYAFFLKKFTSLSLTPEQVFAFGQKEVSRVRKEIEAIRIKLGYTDENDFYSHLSDPVFLITDKQEIIGRFSRIDSIVRKHLPQLAGNLSVPEVYAMEWPDAGPSTPPGIYLGKADNAYGKDVFQFNFFNGKYNRRSMEWLYMHEAIPGHHLQSSLNGNKVPNLRSVFVYPGNFEGWACYVEYLGKDLGLYADPYSLLGKWEWDLVRSARLVLDAGIHYYGWTHEQAIAYWKQNVPGQEEIAEREVNRVTNWAGQVVSYKTGADFIIGLKEKWMRIHPRRKESEFHLRFLQTGSVPLPVIEKNMF